MKREVRSFKAWLKRAGLAGAMAAGLGGWAGDEGGRALAGDGVWRGPILGSSRSGNWNSAFNWNVTPLFSGLPDAPTDDALIDLVPADPYIVTLNISIDLARFTLNSSNATLLINSETMTIHDAGFFTLGTTILDGSTLTGPGQAENSGLMQVPASSTISTSTFQNLGTINISHSNASNDTLTFTNGFSNRGLMNFDSSGSGSSGLVGSTATPLTNESTGLLAFKFGTGTNHVRILGANLNNHGTVQIEAGATLTMNKALGSYVSDGQFNIGAGSTAEMNGGSQVFTLSGGTLDNQGAFNITGAAFNFNGGQITGNAVMMTTGTLQIGPASTGAGMFIFKGLNNMLGGNVAPGQKVTILGTGGGTFVTAAGFSNGGTLELDTDGGGLSSLQVGGVLTISPGGVLRMKTGPGGNPMRTLNAAFENLGLIDIEPGVSASLSGPGTLRNSGLISIAPGAMVTVGGNPNVFVQEIGTLDNQGTMNLGNAAFHFNGGQITGNAINITGGQLVIGAGASGPGLFSFTTPNSTLTGNPAAGQMLTVLGNNMSGGTLTSAGAFTNHGTIHLDSIGVNPSTLVISTGVMTNAADGTLRFKFSGGGAPARTLSGNLTNEGLVKIDGGAAAGFSKPSGLYTNLGQFEIDGGASLTINGLSQVFTQQAGSVTNGGSMTLTGATLNFNGGQFIGAPILLSDSRLNIGAGSTGAGVFNIQGGSAVMSGDVAHDQTLNILAQAGVNTLLKPDGSFTNHGVIKLDSSGSGSSTLQMITGTLNNAADGLLDIRFGTGSNHTRTLATQLDNSGSLVVQGGTTLNLSRGSAAQINRGLFDIGPGATVSVTGGGSTFTQQAGTLNNQGSMTLSGIPMNLSGGTLTGNAVVISGSALSIAPAYVAGGAVSMRGTSSLSGNINAGFTLRVDAIASLAATLTSAAGFTSHGGIILDSSDNTHATLTLTGGTLVNESDGVLRLNTGTGSSRVRTISGNIDNRGQWIIEPDVIHSLPKLGAVYENSGTISSGAGSTLSPATGTFTNQPGGVIQGSGVLVFSNLLFTNHSVMAPGLPGVTKMLTFNGTYNQASDGVLELDYAGTDFNAQQYDRLHVNGSAVLDGQLHVTLAPGFTPTSGNNFTVLNTGGTRTGVFSNIVCGRLPVNGGTFKVQYFPTTVTLSGFTASAGIAADLNDDGKVDDLDLDLLGAAIFSGSTDPQFDMNQDSAVDSLDTTHVVRDVLGTFYGDVNLNCSVTIGDLTVLAENFNGVGGWAQGDFSGNGVISIGDLTLLAENFGQAAPPLIGDEMFAASSFGAGAVPLPAAVWAGLAMLGITGILRRNRR